MNFQTRVKEAIVSTVVEEPGITLRELEVAVAWKVSRHARRNGDYFMGGGYFYQRVERLAKRKKVRKLVYKADGPHETLCGHYFSPEVIPVCFDLRDQTARLVAADYVQEQSREDIAINMRKAVRGN